MKVECMRTDGGSRARLSFVPSFGVHNLSGQHLALAFQTVRYRNWVTHAKIHPLVRIVQF